MAGLTNSERYARSYAGKLNAERRQRHLEDVVRRGDPDEIAAYQRHTPLMPGLSLPSEEFPTPEAPDLQPGTYGEVVVKLADRLLAEIHLPRTTAGLRRFANEIALQLFRTQDFPTIMTWVRPHGLPEATVEISRRAMKLGQQMRPADQDKLAVLNARRIRSVLAAQQAVEADLAALL